VEGRNQILEGDSEESGFEEDIEGTDAGRGEANVET
jgi:hypothetical protein